MQCKQSVLARFLAGVLALAAVGYAVADEKIKTYVTIVPQKYLVERIGGDLVTVDVLVQPGQSPHSYSPSPRQVLALDRADLYFQVGLSLEKQVLEKVRSRGDKPALIDTTKGINYRHMTPAETRGGAHRAASNDHVHLPDGSCCPSEAGAPDPHVWLCPKNAQVMAQHIFEALVERSPKHALEFGENYEKLVRDLKAVDAELKEQLAPLKGRSFYVFHPAYGYLGDAYGLKQVAVEVEGKEPSPKQLAALIRRARSENVKVIFVQPQFSDSSAKLLAREIGGTVVALDPLAYDYIDNLRKKAVEIRRGLEQSKS